MEIIRISYIYGDATAPIGHDNRIIVHICNDIGGWGKGFVTAVSKRWKEPENAYRNWFKEQTGFELGAVQFVQVAENLWVANLIGQHKIYNDPSGLPPIRYDAVQVGLEKISAFALKNKASVHMPRIGCGLAGGTWDKMEVIIHETLTSNGIKVTVYDFG